MIYKYMIVLPSSFVKSLFYFRLFAEIQWFNFGGNAKMQKDRPPLGAVCDGSFRFSGKDIVDFDAVLELRAFCQEEPGKI